MRDNNRMYISGAKLVFDAKGATLKGNILDFAATNEVWPAEFVVSSPKTGTQAVFVRERILSKFENGGQFLGYLYFNKENRLHLVMANK